MDWNVNTVDGSEIPNNHLACIKPCKYRDKGPTSTGERRSSEPSTVWTVFWWGTCKEFRPPKIVWTAGPTWAAGRLGHGQSCFGGGTWNLKKDRRTCFWVSKTENNNRWFIYLIWFKMFFIWFNVIYVSGVLYFHCAREMRAGKSNFYSPTLVGTDRFVFVVGHFYYENWNPSKLQKAKLCFLGLETSVFLIQLFWQKLPTPFSLNMRFFHPKHETTCFCVRYESIYTIVEFLRVRLFSGILFQIATEIDDINKKDENTCCVLGCLIGILIYW